MPLSPPIFVPWRSYSGYGLMIFDMKLMCSVDGCQGCRYVYFYYRASFVLKSLIFLPFDGAYPSHQVHHARSARNIISVFTTTSTNFLSFAPLRFSVGLGNQLTLFFNIANLEIQIFIISIILWWFSNGRLTDKGGMGTVINHFFVLWCVQSGGNLLF